MIERVPFHYGWVILASGALGAFTTTPGQTIGVSSFFDPLAKDLGLSRAEVALSQAMRTAVFWSLSAANILSNALGTGLLLNHYDLLARGGLPREAAAMVFAPLAIAQVLATLATGPVLDRLPPHHLVAVPMTMMATACLLVGTIGSTATAIVYAAALGLALGSFQAINAAAYAHYFGRQHAGEIRGVTFVITIVGAALGPLPFGWFATRGYGPVLAGGAALCLLAPAINLATRSPEPCGPRA